MMSLPDATTTAVAPVSDGADLATMAQTIAQAPAEAPLTAPVVDAVAKPVVNEPEKITMTSEQLKERLMRASSKQLRDVFGTDDVAIIAAKVKAGEAASAKEEAARREKLDEVARYKEDIAKLEREKNLAKLQASKLQQARLIDQEQRRLSALASQHVDPRYAGHAVRDFAAHLRANYTADQIAKITPEQQKRWFAKYAEKRPEIARVRSRPAAEAAPPVRTVPAHNGGSAAVNIAAPSGMTRQKSAKPGDNSMSMDEIQKKYNVSW